MRLTQGVHTLLLPALRDYSMPKYQVCVSLVLVGALTLLQLRAAERSAGHAASGSSSELLSALTPWALHHHHAVRVPAQALLYHVLSEMEGPQPAGGGAQHAAPDAAAGMGMGTMGDTARGMLAFLRASPECVALRSRQALVDLAGWRLAAEVSLQGLLGVRRVVRRPACG